MNKKKLLAIVLIILALGIFVSCEESMSVSIKGTWKSVETEEGVTNTIILDFPDSSFTMDITSETGNVKILTISSGTYTKTDSTITTTLTSMTILGTTYTGSDLVALIGSDDDLTETIDYSITKSGSTVTLNVVGGSFEKQ